MITGNALGNVTVNGNALGNVMITGNALGKCNDHRQLDNVVVMATSWVIIGLERAPARVFVHSFVSFFPNGSLSFLACHSIKQITVQTIYSKNNTNFAKKIVA
jgi:hypothetical protein